MNREREKRKLCFDRENMTGRTPRVQKTDLLPYLADLHGSSDSAYDLFSLLSYGVVMLQQREG